MTDRDRSGSASRLPDRRTKAHRIVAQRSWNSYRIRYREGITGLIGRSKSDEQQDQTKKDRESGMDFIEANGVGAALRVEWQEVNARWYSSTRWAVRSKAGTTSCRGSRHAPGLALRHAGGRVVAEGARRSHPRYDGRRYRGTARYARDNRQSRDCGCRLGGAIALHFAARYPERSSAVVVGSPATGITPNAAPRRSNASPKSRPTAWPSRSRIPC